MQIVIPMSGFGERFRRAGYTVPKPLIEVEGRPIIRHVLDLFPGEREIIFICSEEHLASAAFGMRAALEDCCPTGRILAIPPHKLGPVYAVSRAFDAIDPDRPIVVNYCDFTCTWDWSHFKRFVRDFACDGAIPAYRGFHPHSLGTTNYAYMRERDGWVRDIQEKQPYTSDRLQEYASSGTYYFASGALMREAFEETMRRDLQIGGEYYVSLAYKPLLEARRRIAVYPLQHFMQWGTPDDLAEYQRWSNAFRRLVDPRFARAPVGPAPATDLTVVPMAGLGERFSRAGYLTPKPLIPVSGEPMVVQAVADVPAAQRHLFILRRQMNGAPELARALERRFPDTRILMLDAPTDGQARTVMLGLMDAGADRESITITPCDSGMLFQPAAYDALWARPEVDVIVWVVRGHVNAARSPRMYGWVDADGDRVRRVSVKVPLGDPATDPIVLGTFTFRRAGDFLRCARRLIDRGGTVNGELYVDACINDALDLGLDCRIVEVDSYLCWGTPDDLRTFEYWQSCFHKWPAHPYRLELDSRVAPAAREALDRAAHDWSVHNPGDLE